MVGIEAQHGAEMVLRLGQRVQRMQRDAEIIERLDVIGIEAERLAFALDRLRRPPLAQDGETEIGPGVGALGGKRECGTVEGFRLGATTRILQVDRNGMAEVSVELERGSPANGCCAGSPTHVSTISSEASCNAG